MPKPLVIVESPAKAKTIAGFLGSGYMVESSIGHIRDLPSDADEIPASFKGEPWARLGVDVDNGFKPLYVVVPGKKDRVTKLKALLKDASELYLATDEDREGESIAWHLLEVLNPRVPVKRMVFHEITREAIQRAVDNWRDLDRRLVDAQETRRILDRLYGYEVSPVLWRKVLPRLSAGRVQSVATRLLVERERARMRFRVASYWDIDGRFQATGGGFGAMLVALDGARLATGRDFGETGELTRSDIVRLDETGASGPRGALGRREVHGPHRRGEALAAFALCAVPDVHAAAGGRPQVALFVGEDDACRSGPLRGRPYHLHAHRLDDAFQRGPLGGSACRERALRGRVPPGEPAPLRQAGEERPGGPRSYPPGR